MQFYFVFCLLDWLLLLLLLLQVMKNAKEFFDQSLDEVAVLRLLLANGDPDEHRFLRLLDCLYVEGHLVLVTELLDEDLYTFSTALKRQRLPSFWSLGRLQRAVKDVLLALQFVHSLHIIHGDLKPENILACFSASLAAKLQQKQQQQRLNYKLEAARRQTNGNCGTAPCDNLHYAGDSSSSSSTCSTGSSSTMSSSNGSTLSSSNNINNGGMMPSGGSFFDWDCLDLFRVKVIDFGNCCFTSDELVVYTQSRSYRAPEVLLELPYCQQIDIWSLGCIVYELWTGEMLLGCYSVPSLLAKMVGLLGPIPSYMARCSPLKHQLLDPEGFLYRFIDNISCAQEHRQQNLALQQEPSLSCDLRSPDDTLLSLVQEHLKNGQTRNPRQMNCSSNNNTTSSSGIGSSTSRIVRFFVPKRTSLHQRLRCTDDVFVDFVSKMLQIDPCKRWTAKQLLAHPFLAPGRYIDGIQAP